MTVQIVGLNLSTKYECTMYLFRKKTHALIRLLYVDIHSLKTINQNKTKQKSSSITVPLQSVRTESSQRCFGADLPNGLGIGICLCPLSPECRSASGSEGEVARSDGFQI